MLYLHTVRISIIPTSAIVHKRSLVVVNKLKLFSKHFKSKVMTVTPVLFISGSKVIRFKMKNPKTGFYKIGGCLKFRLQAECNDGAIGELCSWMLYE